MTTAEQEFDLPARKALDENMRWRRKDAVDAKDNAYQGYTVLFVTNTAHLHERHPPQVVYRGDNGHMWSLPLDKWPGNLIPEDNDSPVPAVVNIDTNALERELHKRIKTKLGKKEQGIVMSALREVLSTLTGEEL